MILHIDMDAFFASIEQAINPRLKGKPLIIGSRESKLHTVVCAASYEAKALGIDSGMPSAEAFKICPNLEFVAASQGKYIWTSEQIFQMLKAHNFELRYASIDEFQMDIQEHPDPQALAQKIQQEIFQAFNITASIGVAKNCLLAKLASKINKPNGITVLNEANLSEILAKTPVKKIAGVGEKTNQVLAELGVKTCLDLYQKKAHFLEENLAKYGSNLYLSLHSFEAFGLTETDSGPKSIGHSYTLSRASKNPQFIHAWIRLLSEMVGQRLRAQNLTSNTIHLWLNSPEKGNFNQQKTFQQETSDGYEIFCRALKIIPKFSLGMPKIRAIGVTCSHLLAANYPPLFKEQKRREELIKALDKINSRHGEGSIYPAIISIAKE
ncbi:MAG: DNA polymerase IV [Candidatus Omnitrophica bacterium]|nr:DNA polymerase IV [Candidatus Omnitrophota bacterium]